LAISYTAIRRIAISYKAIVALIGIGILILAIAYAANEISYVTKFEVQFPSLADAIFVIGILAASLSATTLASSLPNSLRIKFRRPKLREISGYKYGFGTVLAVGIGATLGSPLFILIPLNVMQYELVSVLSLILATILSVLMAKVYANMYLQSKRENLGALGGPSFTKIAAGARSMRYFLARLTMFVGNTALAAYSAIVFVLFDFQYIPSILSGYGIFGNEAQLVKYAIAASFVLWFIFNSFFERRLLRLIGIAQVSLTWIMVAILVSQSAFLGNASSWNVAPILGTIQLSPSLNLITALITNTAFLYLLFFGFQEIQVLEKDSAEKSSVPIVSWFRRGYKMDKTSYFDVAMVSSVVIAAAINIFYAIAVYSVHPNLQELSAQQIPALFLSKIVLGVNQEALMSIAFLIATFTTFVPAFMAATRHLSSLSEDGFIPPNISQVAWLFVLVSIVFLAIAGEDFLVNITDFMVLISLGLISFSAIWMRKSEGERRKSRMRFRSELVLPSIVGLSCFVAACGIYLIQSSIAVLGSLAIVVVYLIYDIFELGELGVQLFLALFDIVAFLVLELYPHVSFVDSISFFQFLLPISSNSSILAWISLLSALLLLVNLSIDLSLRKSAKEISALNSVIRSKKSMTDWSGIKRRELHS
jgi:amino acid transporter